MTKTLKNADAIKRELDEAIYSIESCIGDNQYDLGYYEALIMVRDKILH